MLSVRPNLRQPVVDFENARKIDVGVTIMYLMIKCNAFAVQWTASMYAVL